MTFEAIVERFHARHCGAGWLARCPGPLHARGDLNPSLSISEGRDRRVLLHCFAGCSMEAICAATGIEPSDLFSESRTAVQPKPRMVRDAERQIADLRSRLTARERVLSITTIYCGPENLSAGIARALALAVEGELVQVIMEPRG